LPVQSVNPDYLPIAGGVSTIDSRRQITTKIAKPVATIMNVPSSAIVIAIEGPLHEVAKIGQFAQHPSHAGD
jgi:hypothetical protein